jgi:hypothetical protein
VDANSCGWELEKKGPSDVTFSPEGTIYSKGIELHDSSILIDGERVPRALVKPTFIGWSRQIQVDSRHKPGYCKFESKLFSGNRAAFYSDYPGASAANHGTRARYPARMGSSVFLDAQVDSVALESAVLKLEAIMKIIDQPEAPGGKPRLANTILPSRLRLPTTKSRETSRRETFTRCLLERKISTTWQGL